MTGFKCLILGFLIALVFIPALAEEADTIYCGIGETPVQLDPAALLDDSGVYFISNLYETLVRINYLTAKPEPALALSWEAKNNGTLWVFKLRKGVTFHDGEPFNADAVVFSFQRQMDKQFKHRYYDFPLFREIFHNLKSVTKIDDWTVAFELTEPFYPFLAALTSEVASIVSPAAVKKYKADFVKHPAGTGPYMLDQYTKGERVILKAFPHYWDGTVDVKKAVFLMEQQPNGLQRLFRQQKLDIMLSISISRTMGLKRLDWVSVSRTPVLSTTYLVFNVNSKYLKQKNLRRLLCAHWKKGFTTYIFQEFAEHAESLLPPYLPGFRQVNTAKTKAALNAEELLKNTTIPKDMVLQLIITGDSDTLVYKMLDLYCRKLKQKTNITVKLVTMNEETYYKRVINSDYDIATAGWVADYLDPHSFLAPLFSKELQKEGIPTFAAYDDVLIPARLRAAAAESDSEKRYAVYREINDVIVSEALCLPLNYATNGFLFNRKKLQPLKLDYLGRLQLRFIKFVKRNPSTER